MEKLHLMTNGFLKQYINIKQYLSVCHVPCIELHVYVDELV